MTLYKDFIDHYNEYDKFIQQERHMSLPKCSLILFGISGAGKSTFLARLKSDKSAQGFYSDVINRGTERITVEDVTIGRSITSVTVVPRLHHVNNLSIYDVPGFKDTDDNKKIIINILHKCLLNHVKQKKFVAVLRLDLIEEERMTQLIGDYYDSFAQLFGTNYRRCIDNVYFIITHYDKKDISLGEIVHLIKDKIFGAIDLDKAQLAYFLKRLAKKHIVVNYKEDSSEQLSEKLDLLLSDGENESIDPGELTIPHLDVFENELNKRLEVDLNGFIKETKKTLTKNWEKLGTFKNAILESKKNNTARQDKLKTLQTELSLIEEFLGSVDKNIEIIKRSSENLKYEEGTLSSDIVGQESVLAVIDSSLKDERLINVRVDVSQKNMMSGHSIDSIINIDHSLYKDQIILVTRFEQNDDTLKKFFGTNSIIPSDIDAIKKFTGNIVLYNNNISVNKEINVDTSYTDSNNQLRVKISCAVAFKFYLFYTTEIQSTAIPNKLKRTFQEKIQSNKNRIQEIQKDIKNNEEEIKSLMEKDGERRTRQTVLKTEITNLNIEIKNESQKMASNTASLNDELDLQQKNLMGLKDNDLYLTGSKIQKIFNSNKLKSSVNDQILGINKLVDEELLKIQTYRENFATLNKE